MIEARSPHALLPLRIVTDRTRAVSFVVMLIVGAAIFAMFLFLSLFIQDVMGYSPLKSGVAFLPFTVGIVVSAQVASALASRVDPRWIAGSGGALSVLAMYGYGQLTADSGYVGGLLPWIIVQSVGMGLLFVPLTLTAVQRCRQGRLRRRLGGAQHRPAGRRRDRHRGARHRLRQRHHREVDRAGGAPAPGAPALAGAVACARQGRAGVRHHRDVRRGDLDDGGGDR